MAGINRLRLAITSINTALRAVPANYGDGFDVLLTQDDDAIITQDEKYIVRQTVLYFILSQNDDMFVTQNDQTLQVGF